ncbi:MAG: T9SS C-terminal target domain-containing protein [Calditrichaeota bacterium]|nr:MAG: T9SS C-terminal target domain-containing protein [Calditrichota bacterium]
MKTKFLKGILLFCVTLLLEQGNAQNSKNKNPEISGTKFNVGQDLAFTFGTKQTYFFDNDGKMSFFRDDRYDFEKGKILHFPGIDTTFYFLEEYRLFPVSYKNPEIPENLMSVFSAGFWVGGMVNGEKIVSTTVDVDDQTAEFGRIASWTYSSSKNTPKYFDDDGDWNLDSDWNKDGIPSADFDGVLSLDDDRDGRIDEELWDGKDNDGDGKIDEDVGCLSLEDGSFVDEILLSELKDLRELVATYDECKDRFDIEGWIKPNGFWHREVLTGLELIHFPSDANGDLIFDYDPEPKIDEDPPHDKANNLIDDDFDGLFDENDPDFDGDLLPCSKEEIFDYHTKISEFRRTQEFYTENGVKIYEMPKEPLCFDDDNDGRIDEDRSALTTNEFFIGVVDTIESEVFNSDSDGYTPMGVLVTEKIIVSEESFAEEFFILEFEIKNVGTEIIRNTHFGYFIDFDVCFILEGGLACSENDITYFSEHENMAIATGEVFFGNEKIPFFGCKAIYPNSENLTFTYKNYQTNSPTIPTNNAEKYQAMTSGIHENDKYELGDWTTLLSFGPLQDLLPGQTTKVAISYINAMSHEGLVENGRKAELFYESGLKGATAPISPAFRVVSKDENKTEIFWDNLSEKRTFDKFLPNVPSELNSGKNAREDFEGYRVLRRKKGTENFVLLKQFDLKNNGVNFDLGMPKDFVDFNGIGEFLLEPLDSEGNVQVAQDSVSENFGFAYKFEDTNLEFETEYDYVVTAFDNGDNGDGILVEGDEIKILESPREFAKKISTTEEITELDTFVFDAAEDVFVVPNPYLGSHEKETKSGSKNLFFYNVPDEAKIQIFTLSGEKVATLRNQSSNHIVEWNLKNSEENEISAGIYIYKIYTESSERIDKFVIVR